MLPFQDFKTSLKIFEKSINYLDIKQRVQLRRVCKLWSTIIDSLDKEIVDHEDYLSCSIVWPNDTFDFRNIVLDFNFAQALKTSFLNRLRIFKSNHSFASIDLKMFEKFEFLNYLEIGEFFLFEEDNIDIIELSNLKTLFISSLDKDSTGQLVLDTKNLHSCYLGGHTIDYISLRNASTVEYLEFYNTNKRTLKKIFEFTNLKVLICNGILDENKRLKLDNKLLFNLVKQLSKLEEVHCNLGYLDDLSFFHQSVQEATVVMKNCLFPIFKLLSETDLAVRSLDDTNKNQQQAQLKIYLQTVRINGVNRINNFEKEFNLMEPLVNLATKYNTASDKVNYLVSLYYDKSVKLDKNFKLFQYSNLRSLRLIDLDKVSGAHIIHFLQSLNCLIALNVVYVEFDEDNDYFNTFLSLLPDIPSCKTLTQFTLHNERLFRCFVDLNFISKFNWLHYFETNLGEFLIDILIDKIQTPGQLKILITAGEALFEFNIYKFKRDGLIRFDFDILNYPASNELVNSIKDLTSIENLVASYESCRQKILDNQAI